MRTSVFALFAVFGIALATPAILDKVDEDYNPCDEQSEFSDQNCCPRSGPCYFVERIPYPYSLEDLREFCGDESPACCRPHGTDKSEMDCKLVK
ncbi:hypothetical protein V494_05082 [Pseudogymnoascus sp. VKM F-4513 (FW-928)]|nr:hypothetical protein V494_05082 [Pseudogymnoascus sp. VKM F-4513 (FW-928)]